MTDKERLETIKELVKIIESVLYDECRQQELTILIESLYYADHVDWLINRVEELEEERDEWKDTAQSYYMTNQELREQNKRYKRALEFYAHKKNYDIKHLSEDEHEIPVFKDYGEKARLALEGKE